MPLKSDSNLLDSVIGNMPLGIYVIQNDRAIYLNEKFYDLFGFSRNNDLTGKLMFDEIYPDKSSLELFKSLHENMLADNSPEVSWAQPSLKADGTPCWIEIEAKLIEVDNQPAILGTFKDQTDCQFMAEAMAVSQQTLRLLLDAMEDRVYVVTDDFKIVYANRKMIETGCGDPKNDPCHIVCRGLDEPCEACTIDDVFKSGKPIYKEFYNDAKQAWYSAIELPIRLPGLNRQAKLAVARDITQSREANQRIRALSHRLISAQEDERKNLARDLHDDLGQRLNAAKICIDMLSKDLVDISDDASSQLTRVRQILDSSIHSVRNLCSGLRPSALEKLGLVETMRSHCKKIGQLHGINIDFKAAGAQNLNLDNETEINLFRLGQEALHNVIKHANAKQVTIRLVASFPNIRLLVEDNGCGFNENDVLKTPNDGTHLGLVGMEERVDLLKGTFQVKSRPGEGTKVVVDVPCLQ